MSIALRTTSAPSLPRPSSGSDLSHAVAHPAGVCANCGTSVGAPYCGACGQRDLPHNPSARVLVEELWDTFGTIDGKLVRSIALLLTRPGALTVEWLRGRRAPYLTPLALYLTVSGAYFAVVAATFNPREIAARQTADERRLGSRALSRAEARFGTAAAPVRVVVLGGARALATPAEAARAAVPQISHVMFVLVPLFALVAQRVFRSRRWRYPAHLYFALHVFAFYFAASALRRAVTMYGPAPLSAAAGWALGVGTLAYLALAMRRVYGGRWAATVARVAAIGIPFYLAFVVAMLGVGVVSLGLR